MLGVDDELVVLHLHVHLLRLELAHVEPGAHVNVRYRHHRETTDTKEEREEEAVVVVVRGGGGRWWWWW